MLWTGFLIYLCLLLFLYVVQRSILYQPDTTPYTPQSVQGGEVFTHVDVTTPDDLTLKGWYKAPENPNLPVIVLFHGNGGNIASRLFKAADFIAAGYGFLYASYRGYETNPGLPSQSGLLMDGRAYMDWLAAQGIPPSRVVLWGESLGTGIVVRTAADYPDLAALILETPYTSMTDVVQKHYFFLPAWIMVKDKYESIKWIDKVKAPVLVLHGELDEIVPFKQGQRIFEAANEPKEMAVYPHGRHNDLYEYGISRRALAFLEKHLKN